MENKIQKFSNLEFGDLDVLIENDMILFPATECAKILGYANPHATINRHCPHLTKREVGVLTGERQDGSPAYQNVEKGYIPESDLYRLIIRSHLPEAQVFERWVFEEVLPTIRKQGMYFTPQALVEAIRNPDGLIAVLNLLQEEQQKRQQLEVENAFLSVKASYYDTILASKENLPITKIAKDYGMSAVSFNKMLHDLKIQYLMGKSWVLYQEYANQGYTVSRTFILSEEKTVTHMYWTQKGRKFLYTFLLEHGILPVIEQGEENEYI